VVKQVGGLSAGHPTTLLRPAAQAAGGSPLAPGAHAAWQDARRAARLDEVRFHDLRHGAISTWIRAGWSVKRVQTEARHADPAFTLRVYGHLWPDELEQGRAALDAAIASAVGPHTAPVAVDTSGDRLREPIPRIGAPRFELVAPRPTPSRRRPRAASGKPRFAGRSTTMRRAFRVTDAIGVGLRVDDEVVVLVDATLELVQPLSAD
jgi:hypothetical protein